MRVRLDAGRTRPGNRDAVNELAELFCRQARRRADTLFHALWADDDAEQYGTAQAVLDGRYAFFEHDVLDPAGDGPMMPGRDDVVARPRDPAGTAS